MKIVEVGTLEAKTRFSELLSQVQRGQRFYITKHGRRVAELGPLRETGRRRKAGFGKGAFTYVAPDFDVPLEDFRQYME